MDGALPAVAAAQSLDALLQAIGDGLVTLAEDELLVSQALLLALSLDHKLPDCLYLALVERDGGSIATADEKLTRLARSRGIIVRAALTARGLDPSESEFSSQVSGRGRPRVSAALQKQCSLARRSLSAA